MKTICSYSSYTIKNQRLHLNSAQPNGKAKKEQSNGLTAKPEIPNTCNDPQILATPQIIILVSLIF